MFYCVGYVNWMWQLDLKWYNIINIGKLQKNHFYDRSIIFTLLIKNFKNYDWIPQNK